MTDPTPTPPASREAGSLPFPARPVGEPNDEMPFDHLVVVMMENHSFDNLVGELSRTRSDIHGLTFDIAGEATNSNPGVGNLPAEVKAFSLPNTAQAKNVTQSWRATHEQINGGAMDGFVRSAGAAEPMGYYPRAVLPFAYSLADTFTLANQWYCSMPGPTYPNRRFLLAGTAFGGTTTALDALFDHPPRHGTICDRLSEQGISWCDYFTDVPSTAVIPTIILKHLDHHHGIGRFFHDCRAGTLPQVSFVDPSCGVLASIAAHLGSLPAVVRDALRLIGVRIPDVPPGQSEEAPEDMYYGEAWAHGIIQAVLESPVWDRTLLIYTYDEHGGYFDHVEPLRAVAPDDILPRLQPGDPVGDYTIYGPRVPAVVVSPHSSPSGVTDDPHDHTSILATIEHKWNLPALTNRDANAATVMDFLDLETAAFQEPPIMEGPSDTGPSGPAGNSR